MSRLLVTLLLLSAVACALDDAEAQPFGGSSAVLPGQLTVRLRIREGERERSLRLVPVTVSLDTGVRCARPPCEEAEERLDLRAGRDATIRIPVADWSRVRSIRAEGSRILADPGGRAIRLADGSFLLVLEAEGTAAGERP
ncbi:MAG: hypothetical protein RML12_04870 [Xanthomonadales bacterium]|nr:hypothetical protein [Xanthomonadales bacterium]